MPFKGGPAWLAGEAERLLRDERAMAVEGLQEFCRAVLELHRPPDLDPEAVHDHRPGDGRHKPFGAYVDGCPRCELLKVGGAPPKEGWGARRTDGYPTDQERRAHYAPGGPHDRGQCGLVCTFGDW